MRDLLRKAGPSDVELARYVLDNLLIYRQFFKILPSTAKVMGGAIPADFRFEMKQPKIRTLQR